MDMGGGGEYLANTHCKKAHSYNLSLPSMLSYSLTLCLRNITLTNLLIGSHSALLSQWSRPSDPQSLSLFPHGKMQSLPVADEQVNDSVVCPTGNKVD